MNLQEAKALKMGDRNEQVLLVGRAGLDSCVVGRAESADSRSTV